MPIPPARQNTVDLLAASIPLVPDAALVRRRMAGITDWNDVLYLADGHGVTPLLFRLWSRLGLLSLLPADAQERMALAHSDNATRNRDARREFRDLMSLMDEARVETIVLKGLPLLDQLYSDPAERVLYDFDLLAHNEQEAQRGYDALVAAGFTPVPTKKGAAVEKHLPSLWRINGFVRRGYLFDVMQPRPVEMHLTLWDTGWRGLDVLPIPDVWVKSREMQVESRPVRVLSLAHTVVHLCVHLATHLVEREARLGQAIDITRLLDRYGQDIDWQAVLETSNETRVTRFVYLALTAAHILTDAPLPLPAVMETLRAAAPAGLRNWVEANGAMDLMGMDFRNTDLSRAYALTFAATQSWRERVQVMRFALFPPMEALQAEYGASGPLLYARHLRERGRVYLANLRGRHRVAAK